MSIRDRYRQVQVTKAGPFTHMIIFGIGEGCGPPIDCFARGDSHGVPITPRNIP